LEQAEEAVAEQMRKDLAGKVIVITGASSGFGRGAALRFARGGARVAIAARRDEVLDEVAKQVLDLGGEPLAVPVDVGNRDDVEALCRAAVAQFGGIDVWINNAGTGAVGRFEEVPLEDHVRVIETDLLGTLYGSYFAMQRFREQKFGTLINVASVIGKVPAPYFASYAAAKHGVVGLSAAIRQELDANEITDIHVCTVMPTSMDTPFFEHAANYLGRETTPIPELYEAERTVDTIVRLATEPKDEVAVGTEGKFATFFHQLAPKITEALMRKKTHKAEVEDAQPAPNTSGAVHEPTPTGTSVGGGWLKKEAGR
jgi:short-subunit dehydrogenase